MKKVDFGMLAGMFVLVTVTMVAHEAAHWLAGRALGYDMWFTLTRGGPVGGVWRSQADYALVSAAGPLFTITMGVVGAWLAISRRRLLGYELVFAAFMQRAMAMVMSAIATPNDEARISMFLGLEWWVAPAVVVAVLLALTVWSAIRLRVSLATNLMLYLVVSAAFTLMVGLDGQLPGGSGVSVVDPLLPEAARMR